MSCFTAIDIVGPAEFDSRTAQTPGSERRAAIAPALGIASAIWGGLFEGAGIADRNSSSRRAGDDRLRSLRHLRNPLGRPRRIRRARQGRRFHPRPSFPAAHGNQPIETETVSLGCRAQHRNTHCGRPSGRHLAVSWMSSCGPQDGIRPQA
jgi:hypothetical protein